jgi:diguanylate cyclase (GGDEF)-like protein/PAS domain S-box-containing protein
MERDNVLPVLYDMVVTIGSEISVKPLLTRTLQRLLYHTSFSAGFICLNVPSCDSVDGLVEVKLDAVVGDFDLVGMVGKPIAIPCDLICNVAGREINQEALLSALRCTQTQYKAYLRLPINHSGVIVLMAAEIPETTLPLTTMLQPVISHLAKALVLCRSNDQLIADKEANKEKAELFLLQSERNLAALIELSPIGVLFSNDGTTLGANRAFLQMFGYALDEIIGKPFLEMVAQQSHEAMIDRVKRRAQGFDVEQSYEITGLRKDGVEIPLLISANRMILDEGPRTTAFVVDLTDLKHKEYALKSSNEMLHAVIENAPLRVFWKDRDLRYLGCNTAFAHDAGMQTPEDVVGKDDCQMGWHDQADLYRQDDLKVIGSDKPKLAFDEVQTTPDGTDIWLRTSKVPLHDATGQVIGVLGIYDDITAQKQAEAQIHRLAFYDALTNLPNRRLLTDRLQQAFAVGARTGQHGAVLFIDLDNFKMLNDTKGHDIGDMLLTEVAMRLNASVRDGDTVARLGGDEFVVVLESLSSLQDDAATQADTAAEKILAALSQPYQLAEYMYYTTPSIGVVLFLGNQQSLDDVLKFADTAMYQAKTAGRNTIRFYDPVMQAAIEARADLEEELRYALERQQLCLYYQIQIDSSNRTLGAEVLLRWQHPDRGLVSPAQFIPLAEDTGLIIPIGLWVLQTACTQLNIWQSKALTRDLTLAVNVSAKQFRSPDFVAQVQRVIVDSGAKPALLKLELTESIVLENVEDTIAKMRELKLLGVSFSMDDFGTGYSSLQYLKRLPLDQIKIDQSFVRDIVSDPNDAAIVRTIIAMSEVLGLNVIAEGVETEAQRDFLDSRGCHAFQGYLFGVPMPLQDFEASLMK